MRAQADEGASAVLQLPPIGPIACAAQGRGEALLMLREIAEQKCYLGPGGLALREGGTVIDAGANIGASSRCQLPACRSHSQKVTAPLFSTLYIPSPLCCCRNARVEPASQQLPGDFA